VKREPRIFPDEYEGVGGEPAGQVTPEGIKVFLLFLLDYRRIRIWIRIRN
jgi:hypothetical protein